MPLSHLSEDIEPEAATVVLRLVHDYHVAQQEPLRLDLTLSSNDFVAKIDRLQDYFYATASLLHSRDVHKHHFLWLVSLEGLASLLARYKECYVHIVANSAGTLAGGQWTLVGAGLGKLCGDFGEVLRRFATSPDLDMARFVRDGAFVGHFSSLVRRSLELLTADRLEDDASELVDNAPLTFVAVAGLVLKYFSYIDCTFRGEHRQRLLYKSFPLLVAFVQAAYSSGESQLVVLFLSPLRSGLLPIIDPKFPILLVKSLAVQYATLISYYKYVAFNLVTLALQGDKINSKYLHMADVYFKVLLNFPNLNLSVYRDLELEQFLSDSSQGYYENAQLFPTLMVSVQERQEISLLFILHYLLSATTLDSIVSPDHYCKAELTFLVRSLSTTLSRDLDKSASKSYTSRSNSAVSFQQLTELENESRRNQVHSIKFKSLSTIILHGSYKEKLTLVVSFLELFIKKFRNIPRQISQYGFNPIAHSDFEHLVSNIDSVKYPGKILYAQSIMKITRLFNLVGIKHLVASGGVNVLSETVLQGVFCSRDEIPDVLNIKDLLTYSVDSENGERYYTFRVLKESTLTSHDAILEKQAEICSNTVEMRIQAARLE